MTELYSPNELCYRVLSLPSKSEKALSPDLIKNIRFPNYNANEAKSIFIELNNGRSIRSVLLSHSFSFPFFPNLLDDLIINLDKTNYKIIAKFVLYTYLSWKIVEEEMVMLDSTIIHLISSMASLVSFGDKHKKLKIMILSAFMDVYEWIFRNSVNENALENYLSPIYLLFNRTKNIPEKCFEIIGRAAEWIYNTGVDKVILKSYFNFVTTLKLPEICAKALIKIIFQSLFKTDDLFPCLSKLTNFVPQNYYSAFLSGIPANLLCFIEQKEIITKYKVNFNDRFLKLPDKVIDIPNLKLIKDLTFPNGLNLTKNVELPLRIMKFEELINDSVVSKLITLAHIAEEQDIKIILINFIEILKISDNDHILDIYSAFFFFCKLLSINVIESVTFDLIFNDIIFNPGNTIFEQSENFLNINSLRYYAFDIYLNNSSQFNIGNVLYSFMKYPLLFTEILYRMLTYNKFIPKNQTDQLLLANILMKAALFYQSFHLNNSKEIEIARTGIFYFISHIFLDQSILLNFFEDEYFCNSFVSFVFEVPIRPFILKKLLLYLTKTLHFNHLLSNNIINILSIASKLLPDEGYLTLFLEILDTINESIIHKRILASLFTPLVTIIFNSFLKLDTSANSKKLLNQSLHFLSLLLNIHNLKDNERTYIENAVFRVYGDSPTDKIYEIIVQLLAANDTVNANPFFIIRQPGILITFLILFINTPKFLEVLNFIDKLCEYSSYNCKECHESQVDLWIINYIKSNIMDKNLGKYINVLLSIFTKISLVSSSVPVVQCFFYLFSPNDGKLSDYNSLFIDTLVKIINMSKKLPRTNIPLISDYRLSIKGINSAQVDSFHMLFWIYINDVSIPQYNPLIFRVSDGNKSIELSFLSNLIKFNLTTNNFYTVGNIKLKIPQNEWALFYFNYENINEQNGAIFKASVNLGKKEKINIPYYKWNPKSNIVIEIGGVLDDNVSPEFPSLISSFGLFSELTEDNLRNIKENGPCFLRNIPDSCLFYYQPFVNDYSYDFIPFHKQSDINLQTQFPQNKIPIPFVYVLIQKLNMNYLIPLFLNLSIIDDKSKSVPYSLEVVLDLFSTLFQLSDESQISFLEGFGIISSLLYELPPSDRNYNLYLNFFNLSKSITIFELQNNLFSSILINLELWIDIDPENHMKILRHWARVLFPYFQSIISIDLNDILSALRTYYYYADDNNNSNICKRRNSNLNIAECRSILFSICCNLKTNSFSFYSFIGQLVTISDSKQVKDLLSFLIHQIDCGKLGIDDKKNYLGPITILASVFNFYDDQIDCLFFQIIFKLHRNNYILDCSLEEHIDIILHQLTISFVRKTLFHSLIQLMIKERYYELLPICCWVSLNLQLEEIEFFIKLLSPNLNYSTCSTWSFWVIILLQKLTNNKLVEKLILFLLLSDRNYWLTTYHLFDVVEIITNKDISNLKKSFINSFYKLLINKTINLTSNTATIYFNILNDYIFFHNEVEAKNGIVNKFFKSDVFPLNKFSSKTFFRRYSIIDLENSSCILPYQITQKILNFEDLDFKKLFKLRLDKEFNWIDFDISLKSMNLFLLVNDHSFLLLDLILCFFVNKYEVYKLKVKEHIDNLMLQPNEIIEYQSLLKYLKDKIIETPNNALSRFAEQNIKVSDCYYEISRFLHSSRIKIEKSFEKMGDNEILNSASTWKESVKMQQINRNHYREMLNKCNELY